MRDPPGEERLRLRAAFQNVTGARKSRVLLLLAVIALFLMALVYGIATTGRGAKEKSTASDVTPGGGEWLKKIPDTPVRAPEPPAPAPEKALPLPAHPLPPPVSPRRAPAAAPPPQLSPEEQFRLEREKKRREALLAALSAPPVSGNATGTTSTRAPLIPPQGAPERGIAPDMSSLSRIANPGVFRGREGTGEDTQNFQAEKAEFLKATAARYPGYLDEARTPPLGEYEVKAGSIIPAVLLSGINSDLPGAVVAQVRETVYDYVSARHVLIPQGSRLIGGATTAGLPTGRSGCSSSGSGFSFRTVRV